MEKLIPTPTETAEEVERKMRESNTPKECPKKEKIPDEEAGLVCAMMLFGGC